MISKVFKFHYNKCNCLSTSLCMLSTSLFYSAIVIMSTMRFYVLLEIITETLYHLSVIFWWATVSAHKWPGGPSVYFLFVLSFVFFASFYGWIKWINGGMWMCTTQLLLSVSRILVPAQQNSSVMIGLVNSEKIILLSDVFHFSYFILLVG